MAEMMLVRAEALTNFPKAFQDFVNEHFAKKKIGDTEYLYAFRWVLQPSKTTKGNAPGHRADIGHYSGGLKEGQSLPDWIDEYLKDPTHTDIVSFYGSEYRMPNEGYDD